MDHYRSSLDKTCLYQDHLLYLKEKQMTLFSLDKTPNIHNRYIYGMVVFAKILCPNAYQIHELNILHTWDHFFTFLVVDMIRL